MLKPNKTISWRHIMYIKNIKLAPIIKTTLILNASLLIKAVLIIINLKNQIPKLLHLETKTPQESLVSPVSRAQA